MTAIDPHRRWEGPEGKPEYAGFLSFAGLPYSESPEDLDGVDVAVVGAPIDELVSDRPGTRFGPRAIRAASGLAGPQLDVGVDALEVLRLLDYGDAPIVPADPVASHAAIERTLGEVLDAGAIPLVLGGDHSIVEPEIRACAAKHGPVGLVHFDTHTDTGAEVFEAKLSHGTPMYRLVEAGQIDAARYVQIGLRGYWPGEAEFAWQAEHGITALPMRAVFERGIADVVAEAIAIVDQGPTFVSVDVDVLDPAYAPGTGTPEPGGMTSADLLWAAREVAARVDLVGADVVEVLPTLIGSQDITALVAGRIARELLTGIAIRRVGD